MPPFSTNSEARPGAAHIGENCGAEGYPGGVADAAILVVDDDAPIRRMLERTLAAGGYGVGLAAEADFAPVTRAVWVCALYTIVPLVAAYLVFLRRDVAGV